MMNIIMHRINIEFWPKLITKMKVVIYLLNIKIYVPKVIASMTVVFLLSQISFLENIRTKYRVFGVILYRRFDILVCMLSMIGSDNVHFSLATCWCSMKNVWGWPPLYSGHHDTSRCLSYGITDTFDGDFGHSAF